MKNNDILLLAQELPKLSPPNMERWFNYGVQETIERATAKAKNIREVVKPKEKMAEYQDEVKKLQEKHSHKDEYDKPITTITDVGGGRQIEKYEIIDIKNPKGKFNVAAEKLTKKYQKDIDEYNKGLEFLEEENKDFEPYWVTVDQIPDGLTRNEMAIVKLMIKSKDAEEKA